MKLSMYNTDTQDNLEMIPLLAVLSVNVPQVLYITVNTTIPVTLP